MANGPGRDVGIEVLAPLSLRITNDKATALLPDQFERNYLVAKENVVMPKVARPGQTMTLAPP